MEKMIKDASKESVNLIAFPELCLTGYDDNMCESPQVEMHIKNAENFDGPSVQRILHLSKEFKIIVIFGMPERDGSFVYNSAIVTTPEGNIEKYRKIHPYGPENKWCQKGDKPLIVDTNFGKIGIGICYDSYQFPELVRYYTAKGCKLYISITAQCENIEISTSRDIFKNYYFHTLAAISLSNEIAVLSSNLVGKDRITYFGGASIVIVPKQKTSGVEHDPIAKIIAGSLDDIDEGTKICTIDLDASTRGIYQNNIFTGSSDFRADVYARLYQELAELKKDKL